MDQRRLSSQRQFTGSFGYQNQGLQESRIPSFCRQDTERMGTRYRIGTQKYRGQKAIYEREESLGRRGVGEREEWDR